MSATNPPDPNVNTFNNLYWITGDTALTQEVADKRYLRFPTAQGTENLAAINVNGLATFNSDAVINANLLIDDVTNSTSSIIEQNNLILRIGSCSNSATPNSNISFYATDPTGAVVQQVEITNNATQINNNISQVGTNTKISQDNTTNSTPNTLRPTDIYGDLNLRKPTATTGGAMRLWDITASSGNSSQIYNTGTQMALVNLNNNGAITLNTKDGTGNSVQTLQVYSSVTNSAKPLNFTGAANTDRIINNVYYQLQDTNSLATTTGQIYAGSGVFNYDNDANGGTHTFAVNDAGGVQTIPLSFNSVDMTIGTTNPPTCNASSTILLTDDSNKLPSTAWVRDYVTSVAPPSPVTFVSTASTTGYNAGGNYTYWYFTSYPTWAAYSWVFNTPKTSRTNVNKTGLGSSPPLNVGTIGANGSFLFMTGNGISQGYTATSSTMITYCAGFQQNYTISAGATAAVLSVINCIGGTPASPIFQSNQLAENNGTCPPSAFGLSGYIILQMLNGDYTGLGTPTLTFTQIIA